MEWHAAAVSGTSSTRAIMTFAYAKAGCGQSDRIEAGSRGKRSSRSRMSHHPNHLAVRLRLVRPSTVVVPES
jgi:hypothetical protein